MTSDERKVLVDVMLAEIGTAEKYNSLVADLQAEIARLRLTPEERMAVAWAVDAAGNDMHPAEDILRGLLKRTSAAHTTPGEGSKQDEGT